MRVIDCNRLALGAVIRYPLRTTMMLLAISIGVGSVLILTSMGESARAYISGEFHINRWLESQGHSIQGLVDHCAREIPLDRIRAKPCRMAE